MTRREVWLPYGDDRTLVVEEGKNGVVGYYLDGELVGTREPGWYKPATDGVCVTIGESTLTQAGFRIPVTIHDHRDDSEHKFIATGLRGEDGGTVIRYGDRFIMQCPDRPAVGLWHKVDGASR
jgi:hypothetical protein